ncbi:hypothetical protein OUZ56_004413 [Daphnia magna]|uniref:Uncharacterized protein n=1 Tax=Daphnia magna TaxID=35525 RepID=A0ABQ9YPP8_9CRUS|nr:hypothetical protein OUZ56_004413 [Daphnia magna]
MTPETVESGWFHTEGKTAQLQRRRWGRTKGVGSRHVDEEGKSAKGRRRSHNSMGLDFMLFYLMALYNNGTLSLAMLHE